MITRRIVSTTIKGFKLELIDGTPKTEEIEPVVVAGKVSEKVAMRLLKNKYGNTSAITVSSIEETEDTYEISVEDFMKYAHKVGSNETEVTE